ncbi:hypothetical protein [Mesorhizobium sp. URHB0026]
MKDRSYPPPALRHLQVYAFDPQASTRLESASFNVAVISLPWEQEELDELLAPGPVNSYLEVIDIDPVSDQFYDPIDLNDPFLLAQDGLRPSEGDPRFHQQMVFAVAMKTIRAFERALGRVVLWSPTWNQTTASYEPVERLRIYPHALREPNAYYSPDKKALLFGYFRSSARDTGANWVFTALSHDVVAHETTHAILDGLHRRYTEATSVDSLAFHEAFADIVALLSHFTLSEAVYNEISVNGGSLDERTLMSGLAKQFGAAVGRAGALREAIDDKIDGLPDPTLLQSLVEPHDRGAVLVAAIFDAFLTIYSRRTADLLRIANVTLEKGVRHDLHPDLAARLTREAVKSADHVLRMCIRSLDYLPPVDVRFGEFLRALITADFDLVPDDPYGYRLAVIEAFRRRGIVPSGCLSLAVDSLVWERPDDDLSVDDIKGLDLEARFKRSEATALAESNRKIFASWFYGTDPNDEKWQQACGVIFNEKLRECGPLPTVSRWPDRNDGRTRKYPAVDVHSVRTTRRAGPDGQDIRQLIVEVSQRRRGFFKVVDQESQDADTGGEIRAQDFVFRGGATLIFDLRNRKLRYAIRKRIDDGDRLAEQREFLDQHRNLGALGAAYGDNAWAAKEPFAMVHRGA